MPADLDALRQRLERAEGADRELDGLVLSVCGYDVKRWSSEWSIRKQGSSKWQRGMPHVTRSLDAAVALVQRVRPGWFWCAGNAIDGAEGRVTDLNRLYIENARTAPLALLLALVRSLIKEQP